MRLLLLLATSLSLTACASDPYVIRGSDSEDSADGVDDNTDALVYDAAPAGVDGGVRGRGRVCLLNDLRAWGACAASGAADLEVTAVAIGGVVGTTTTDDDGRFTLDLPADLPDAVIVSVIGAGVAASAVLLDDPTNIRLPAPTSAHWIDVQNAGGLLLPDGTGSLAVRLQTAGELAAGVGVDPTPAANNLPIYDGAAADTWTFVETGAAGVAIVAGAAPGTIDLLASADNGSVTLGPYPIYDGVIFFTDAEFAPE